MLVKYFMPDCISGNENKLTDLFVQAPRKEKNRHGVGCDVLRQDELSELNIVGLLCRPFC
jgi:hypothetical protein